MTKEIVACKKCKFCLPNAKGDYVWRCYRWPPLPIYYPPDPGFLHGHVSTEYPIVQPLNNVIFYGCCEGEERNDKTDG